MNIDPKDAEATNPNAGRGTAPDAALPPLIWLVPVAITLFAVLPLPYGYYNMLRVVVTGFALWATWIEYERSKGAMEMPVIVFGAMALLYNPIIPVHIFKELWVFLNVMTAIAFVRQYRESKRAVGDGALSD